MKYKILNQTDRVELFVLYDDNTFIILNLAQDTLENMLKNAYILSKNTERLQYEGEIPKDLEVYDITPVATTLKADFNNLTGKVYDQYGMQMETEIQFSIEGEHARIEDNKIIKDAVDTDTSYFIVAKCGELEQRQERTIYAPVEHIEQPNLQAEIEALKKEIDILTGVTE